MNKEIPKIGCVGHDCDECQDRHLIHIDWVVALAVVIGLLGFGGGIYVGMHKAPSEVKGCTEPQTEHDKTIFKLVYNKEGVLVPSCQYETILPKTGKYEGGGK